MGMVEFDAALAHLRSLNLPFGDYAIFGSGPLIVRGWIRLANDVDVVCRGQAWATVQSQGALVHLDDWDVDIIEMLDGSLTFGSCWKAGEIDVDEVIDQAERIQGLPFARLDHVAEFKRATGRKKDLVHLAAMAANGYR